MESLPQRIQRLLGAEGSDQQFVVKQAGGMYLARIIYKVINFLIAVSLANLLTISDFGSYNLAFSWATLLTVLAMLGIDRLAIRELAHFHIQHHWSLLSGFLNWAFRSVAIQLPLAALVFVVGTLLFVRDESLQTTFFVAALLIPAFGFVRMLQASSEGLKVIALGRIPDMIVQPIAFVISMYIVTLVLPNWLNSEIAVGLYAITTIFFSVGFGYLIFQRAVPHNVREVRAEYEKDSWVSRSRAFLLINLLYTADTRMSTLLLGFLASKEMVALYNATTRGTDLISFILIAFSPPIVRVALQAYLQGKQAKLQRVITRSVWAMFLISIPIALGLIFAGKWFLRIFGENYIPAYPALVILCLGEVINLMTGNLGQLLSTAGFEKDISRVMVLSLGLNVVLGLLLIPRFGFIGAAVSETSSLGLRNVLFGVLAKKKMDINFPMLIHPLR